MSGDPFPVSALDANRRGRLAPEQRHVLGGAARQTARTGVRVGLVLIVFGALLLFGALTGRLRTVLGPTALGVVLVAGGVALLRARGLGRGGRASERAGAGDDRVETVRGYLRRQDSARGVADQALGLRPSGSPDDERDRYLHIGDRRFAVSEEQFRAAPADGFVHAYVLPGSDVLVNLERVGPGPGQVVGSAIASDLGVPPPSPPAPPLAPPRPGPAPDRQAVVGRWWNPARGRVLDLRADGAALSGRGRAVEPSRWQLRGDVLECGGERFRVSLGPGRLVLTDEDGGSLTIHPGGPPA